MNDIQRLLAELSRAKEEFFSIETRRNLLNADLARASAQVINLKNQLAAEMRALHATTDRHNPEVSK